MRIDEFSLAWRWTQPSHAVLPPAVLESLEPMPANEANDLYRRGEALFPVHAIQARQHDATGDPDATRVWLNTLPFPTDARARLVWNGATGISLPWQTFFEYWDDFCYPSSDDAFVFIEGVTAALAWNHDEVFEFVEQEVDPAADPLEE